MIKAPVLAVLVAGLLTLSACRGGTEAPQPSAHRSSASPPAPVPSTPTSHAPTTHAPTPAELRRAASQRIKHLTRGHPTASVAALNLATGASYHYGVRSGIWTASVFKLLVLESLALQRQREGTSMSDYERDLATRAMENSDNPSGYSIFLAQGGNSGLVTGIRRLGLRHTVPGETDPTFTRTGAGDCVVLLRNLVSTDSPLDKRSRGYILHLMHNVESDQRWGVGVVADHDTDFANKNGWLSVGDSNGPGEDDGGLWVTNSVGIVTVHGQRVLMAVLTEHNSDFDTGVRLVQAVAKAAVTGVTRSH